MADAHAKHHDYHLVDPSPWPAVGSVSAFITAVGAISWMHHLFTGAPAVFGIGVTDPFLSVDVLVQGIEAGFVAMAGQRMHVPGFIEVSAVCTHPDTRGRGYARTLMSTVMEDIFSQGATPFLHVLPDNHSAIRVYRDLGFVHRCTFHLAILRNEQ